MCFPKNWCETDSTITPAFNTNTFFYSFRNDQPIKECEKDMDLARYRIEEILKKDGGTMKHDARDYGKPGNKTPEDAFFVVSCSQKTAKRIDKEVACGLHLKR